MKRLAHTYSDTTQRTIVSEELSCPVVDVDALLSIIVDSEYEYYLANNGVGSFSLESVIDWFIFETLDNIGSKESFFIKALKEYSMELANAIIEQITKHRNKNNGNLHYHFERRTHGGCIRLRQEAGTVRLV